MKKENELRPAFDALPMPTGAYIARMIADIPAFDKHAARYGMTLPSKRSAVVTGHSVTHAPLERAEIDQRCLDLMVVDDQVWLCRWAGRQVTA